MNQLYFGGKVINLYSEDYQYLQDSVSESLNQVVRYLITNKTNSSIIQGFSLSRSESDTTRFNITHNTDNGKGALVTGNQEIFETSTGFTSVALKDYTLGTVIGVYALIDYVYASYDRKNEAIVDEPKVVDLYDNTLVYNRKELRCSLEQYTAAEYTALSSDTQIRLILLGSFTANGSGNPISAVDLSDVDYMVLNIQDHSISVDNLQNSFKLPQAMVQITSTGDVRDDYYATSTGFVDNLTGDLNHIRTMIRDIKGSVNWDDAMSGLYASIPQMNELSKAGVFIDTSTGLVGFDIILSETSTGFVIDTGCALIDDNIKLVRTNTSLSFMPVDETPVGDWSLKSGGEIVDIPDILSDYTFTVYSCADGSAQVDRSNFHIVRNSNKNLEYTMVPEGVTPDPLVHDYSLDPVTGQVTVLYSGQMSNQDVMLFYTYGTNRIDLIALTTSGVVVTQGVSDVIPTPPALLTSHCPLYYVNRSPFKDIPDYEDLTDLRYTKKPIKEITVINCEDLATYEDNVFYPTHYWGLNKLTVVNNTTGFATPKGTGWDILDDWTVPGSYISEDLKCLQVDPGYSCQTIVHFQQDDELWVQTHATADAMYVEVESVFNSNIFDQVYTINHKSDSIIGGVTLLAHKGFDEGYKKVKITTGDRLIATISTTYPLRSMAHAGGYFYLLQDNDPNPNVIVKTNSSFVPIATISINVADIIAVNSTILWAVTYESSAKLIRINTTTDLVVSTITISNNRGSLDLFTNDTYIWVGISVDESYNVLKLDALTGSIISTISLSTMPISYAYDGTYLWILELSYGQILKVNAITDAIVSIATLTDNIDLHFYGISFDGTDIWVSGVENSTLYKINASTLVVLYSFTISNTIGLGYLFYSRGYIWASHLGDNILYKVSTTANSVLQSFNIPQGGALSNHNHLFNNDILNIASTDGITRIQIGEKFSIKNIITGKLDHYYSRIGLYSDVLTTQYLISTISDQGYDGSAPMFVNSRGKVDNLNSDTVDNHHIAETLQNGRLIQYNSTSNELESQVGDLQFNEKIYIHDDTDSTSSSTGALIVSGGLGIAKSVNIGGMLIVAPPSNEVFLPISAISVSVGSVNSKCIKDVNGYLWFYSIYRSVSKIDITNEQPEILFTSASTNTTDICLSENYIWYADYSGSGHIYKVNILTNLVIGTITVLHPYSLAFDGNYLWCNTYDRNFLLKVDPNTDMIVYTIAIGSLAYSLVFDGTYLWCGTSTNGFFKINVSTNAIIWSVSINSYINCLASDGQYLWIRSQDSNYTIFKINTTTNAIIGTITIDGSINSISYNNNYLWVSSTKDALLLDLYKVDAESDIVSYVYTADTLSGEGSASAIDEDIWLAIEADNLIRCLCTAKVETASLNTDKAFIDQLFVNESFIDNTIISVVEDQEEDFTLSEGATADPLILPIVPIGTTYYYGVTYCTESLLHLIDSNIINTIAATITLASPYVNCFDGEYIWACHYNGKAIIKINATTNSFYYTVTIGISPTAMCFDGTNIWAIGYSENGIVKVNASSHAILTTMSLGGAPRGLCYGGGFIWAASTGSDTISKINASTNEFVYTITVGTNPRSICFDGTYIWVANETSNNVSKIDTTTDSIVATIACCQGPIALCSAGSYIWVLSDTLIIKVNSITNTLMYTVNLTGNSSCLSVCFDGTYIWVVNQDSLGRVLQINPRALTAASALVCTVEVGSMPRGICYADPYLWISNVTGTNVSKIAVNQIKLGAIYPETMLINSESITLGTSSYINVRLPISINSKVKGRKIYRRTSSTSWAAIDYIDDNTTTLYVDYLRDKSIFIDKTSSYYNKYYNPPVCNTTGECLKTSEGRILELTFDGKRYC